MFEVWVCAGRIVSRCKKLGLSYMRCSAWSGCQCGHKHSQGWGINPWGEGV